MSHAEKVVEIALHSMLQELCCVCVLIFRQCQTPSLSTALHAMTSC